MARRIEWLILGGLGLGSAALAEETASPFISPELVPPRPTAVSGETAATTATETAPPPATPPAGPAPSAPPSETAQTPNAPQPALRFQEHPQTGGVEIKQQASQTAPQQRVQGTQRAAGQEQSAKGTSAKSGSSKAAAPSEKKGTGEKTATASEKAKAPAPAEPLDAIERSIREAEQAGGIPMDPRLREIRLPGLKGDDPTLKPWVIQTRNGVNEVVKVSKDFLNRIATPFAKPLLVHAPNAFASAKVVGSDVYLQPNGDQPVGIFIIDGDDKGNTISLTLLPAGGIPGQNVLVKLEDYRPSAPAIVGEDSALAIGEPEGGYLATIRTLMIQGIRGQLPNFTPTPLAGGVAAIGALEVKPELVFAGQQWDLYRYAIRNTGKEPLDLQEQAFYRKGVRAVAFFPHLQLQPGESGHVFILADKAIVPVASGRNESKAKRRTRSEEDAG